jgi:hypothetical protein
MMLESQRMAYSLTLIHKYPALSPNGILAKTSFPKFKGMAVTKQ